MSFRWRRLRRFGTALVLCVLASSASPANLPITAWWAQRKVTSGKFPIHSACMMPAQAQLILIGLKGAEGLTKQSEAWAASLEGMVEAHLRSQGIAISSASDALTSGASENEIHSAMAEVQQKFHSVFPLMRKKPGGLEKSAYSLGDEVGTLPCSENSDILVFVQGAGQMITQNRSNMTALVGGPDEDAVVYVTMADAKTGEVVAFVQVYPTDASLLDVESAFGLKLSQQFAEMKLGVKRR